MHFSTSCGCFTMPSILHGGLNDGSNMIAILDIVPIVMAGIIGIYGLVVSVLIANDLQQKVALYTGFIQLGAGLAVGLAGMAAGYVHLLQGEVG